MGHLRRDVLLNFNQDIMTDKLHKLIEDINPIFKVDNVAKYYWQSQKDNWKITDYPNLAPPFPGFWMEYKLPKTIHSEGHFRKQHEDLQVGCLFTTELVENEEYKWIISIMTFMKSEGLGILTGNEIAVRLPIKEDGSVWKGIMFSIGENMIKDFGERESVDFLINYIQPFFLAISFLHCKNVEQVERNLDIPRKERRPKDYFEKYHILKIEPMRKILASEGKSESTGLRNALHICRGHFKDYRDSGLFGRHPGIYWWDSQVRGDRRVGIVNKDYEVK